MNPILELLDSTWLNALGCTLLHSLWQALIIAGIIVMLLRFVPSKFSNERYLIAAAGLLLILCWSIGTYFYFLTESHGSITAHAVQTQRSSSQSSEQIYLPVMSTYIATVTAFIRENIPVFMLLWMLGAAFFTLRIAAGLIIIHNLRQQSIILQNDWTKRLHMLANRLNINRLVRLAESSSIQAPVVIGFLKPLILIPIGMTSSLSTEQLETIFLHELMHVRRKDYLINLMQSCVEAIYFFNPFVWTISGIIKREREHCCDDAVVYYYGNAKPYVNALATLEELRLAKAGLSLSLAENKNLLLHRIKRLMERSVKTYSSRERIIPALLLVIGLVCASWISSHTQDRPSSSSNQAVISDTTKKDKKEKLSKKEKTAKATEKAAKKSKQPNKEVSESSDLGVPPAPIPNMNNENDVVAPLDMDIGAMVPPIPDINSLLDNAGPGMNWQSAKDWEEFSKEFEATFKNKFEDFYAKHEKDIEQMMKEAHEKMEKKLGHNRELMMEDYAKRQEDWAKANAQRWEEAAKRQEEWAEANARRWEEAAKRMAERQEAQAKLSKERLQQLEELQHLRHEEFEKNRAEFEERMKAFEEKNKRFDAELRAELIADGYLQPDERIENMHWHNGKVEINGKKIKPEHEKKYNELHYKYFQGIGPRP